MCFYMCQNIDSKERFFFKESFGEANPKEGGINQANFILLCSSHPHQEAMEQCQQIIQGKS